MRATWPLLLVLAACSGKSGDTVETDTDTDVTSGDDTDTNGGGDDTDTSDTDVPLTASLEGTVTDWQGNPVSHARMNVCKDSCKSVFTDDSGHYSYPALEAWTAAFYIVPSSADLATPLVELTLQENEARTQDVVLPKNVSKALPSKATDVDFGNGLHLTIGSDNLDPPSFGDPYTTVTAASPAEGDTLPVDLASAPYAMWYVGPFEATSTSGIPVTIDNQWSLTAGTVVDVWVAMPPPEDVWEKVGTLTVSDDGATLSGDATLPVLTTVAIAPQ